MTARGLSEEVEVITTLFAKIKPKLKAKINSIEVEPDLRLNNLKSRTIYLSRLNIENRIAEDEN